MFVCPFFVAQNEKKRFPFASKKTTTSFFTFCSFLVSPKMKKTSFPFAWLWTKKKHQQLSLFVCSFFASPNDDNWWQVSRWYGIPNLVMTWWRRWVVVTKVSKCWWRHIEMVPYIENWKTHVFFFQFLISLNLYRTGNSPLPRTASLCVQKPWLAS